MFFVASRYRTGEISIHFIVHNITMACNSIFYKFSLVFPIGSYLINVAICFIISNNNFYRHCVYMEYLRSDKSDREKEEEDENVICKRKYQQKIVASSSLAHILSSFFSRYKHVLSPSGCDKSVSFESFVFTPTRKRDPLLESTLVSPIETTSVYTLLMKRAFKLTF